MRRRMPARTVERMEAMRPSPKISRRASTPARLVLLAILPLASAGCFGGSTGKAGGAAERHRVVLTMASQISGGQPEQLVRFADAVARRARGTIRIAFRANWRAGDPYQEADTIADVRVGRVDLAWVGARAWDWLGVKSFDPLVAPFLVNSHALERSVFERGIPQRMLPAVARAGVVPIGVLPGPLRVVLGVRRPLVAPADFRGQTIGVQGVVAAETLRALGARPRQLFAQQPLTGLDGIEEQLNAIVGNQHYKHAEDLSANVALWARPLVIFAAPKTFRALTPRQQDALRAGTATAVAAAMAASTLEDSQAARSLCRLGVTFVAAKRSQLAALRRAVAPVYRRLERNARTRKRMAEIVALKRATQPDPAIRCAASATSAATTGAASLLDGTWSMSVSRADLVGNPAYGHTPSAEDLVLDVGRYRLLLHDGRFRLAAVGPALHSRDRGVFSVRGDTVVFRVMAGHDVGETWAYRWSIYRAALTFRRPPPGYNPGPPNPAFAPWHRAGP